VGFFLRRWSIPRLANRYDAHTLAQQAVFNTSPDASDSAIWQGDAGPAADRTATFLWSPEMANSMHQQRPGRPRLRRHRIKTESRAKNLSLLDYFTPFNQAQLDHNDNDLGSSGPGTPLCQPGPHPHLLVTAGKKAASISSIAITSANFSPATIRTPCKPSSPLAVPSAPWPIGTSTFSSSVANRTFKTLLSATAN